MPTLKSRLFLLVKVGLKSEYFHHFAPYFDAIKIYTIHCNQFHVHNIEIHNKEVLCEGYYIYLTKYCHIYRF